MWFVFWPVCATWLAYTGARAQPTTISTKRTKNARATLFRRRRRHARNHGLRPWIRVPCSAAASSAAVSRVNWLSVAGWATRASERERRGRRTRRPRPQTTPSPLLVTDRGVVELLEHLLDAAAQVDIRVEEVDELQ